jgi:hypothetical protein
MTDIAVVVKILHLFLTSTPDVGDRSPSRHGHFGESDRHPPWGGSGGSHTNSAVRFGEQKNSLPLVGFKPRSVHSHASHHIDYALPSVFKTKSTWNFVRPSFHTNRKINKCMPTLQHTGPVHTKWRARTDSSTSPSSTPVALVAMSVNLLTAVFFLIHFYFTFDTVQIFFQTG